MKRPPMLRGRARAWALAVPGVLLAGIGIIHPMHLTHATAKRWWMIDVLLLPIFPLLGIAVAALVRRRRDPLALGIITTTYLYATFYTGMDVLGGIGAGYVVDHTPGPRTQEVREIIRIGNDLGTWGARALVVGAILLSVDQLVRHGTRALAPSIVLLLASYSLLDSHIYRWRGVLTVLAIGLATSAFAHLRRGPLRLRLLLNLR